MSVFTEGEPSDIGLQNSAVGSRESYNFTTETSVLCIKNKPVFQNVENRTEYQPLSLTFSANGAGAAKFTTLKIVENPVLGGDPVFTDVSTETSIMSFDTAGTTLTGGNTLAAFEFGADVSNFPPIDLSHIITRQPPGHLLCFSALINGGTSDIDVGIIWREFF